MGDVVNPAVGTVRSLRAVDADFRGLTHEAQSAPLQPTPRAVLPPGRHFNVVPPAPGPTPPRPSEELGALATRRDLAAKLLRRSGTADASDVELVNQELLKLPVAQLRRLVRAKVKVIVVRNAITEHYEHLRGQRPRGWPPGVTWDDVPGVANGRDVVIATREGPQGRRVPPTGDGHGAFNLTLHEVGHVLDHVGNGTSTDDEVFRAARCEDFPRLGPYFQQPGVAGREETFASTYARYFGRDRTLAEDWPALFGYAQQAWGANQQGDERNRPTHRYRLHSAGRNDHPSSACS